jgi:hypothetical protein
MGLSQHQLTILRKLLEGEGSFKREVDELRKRPFLDPKTGKRLSLEEASEVVPGSWQIAILAGLTAAMCVCLAVIIYVAARADFDSQSVVASLHKHELALWIGLGFVFSAMFACLRSFRYPAHIAESLLGRLLQESLGEAKPISSAQIVRILRDWRFKDVLVRASDRFLPEANSTQGWKAFADRLLEAIKNADDFAVLFDDHPMNLNSGERQQNDKIDPAIERYLIYAIRKRLFTAIAADPDLRYIYLSLPQWLRRVEHWFGTIDVAKAKELFSGLSEGGSARAANLQGIANITLIVLVIHIVSSSLSPSQNGTTNGSGQQLTNAVKNQVDDFQHAVGDFKYSIDQLGQSYLFRASEPAQCPAPSPVTIQTPNLQPTVVTVPPPTISIPPKLTFEMDKPPISFPPTLSIDVASHSPKVNQDPTPQPKVSHVQPVGDTLLVLGPDAGQANGRNLLTLYADTFSCSYTATLVSQNPWPPDPVAVRLANSDTNGQDCPKLDSRPPAILYAGRRSIEYERLAVSASVEEMHSKWLGLGKNFIVIRVRSRNGQTVPGTAAPPTQPTLNDTASNGVGPLR